MLQKSNPILSEQYIDQALRIENNNEARIIKSRLLINNFKYDQAINYLKNIDSAESNYLIGISHLAIGDDEKGKCYLEKIFKI